MNVSKPRFIPTWADVARADRLSRQSGAGAILEVDSNWVAVDDIHNELERGWHHHWLKQLDVFIWNLRECLAQRWFSADKRDFYHHLCLTMQSEVLLALFPLDYPGKWIFVMGNPELCEEELKCHTPDWLNQEQVACFYRFRWVNAYVLHSVAGIFTLEGKHNMGEYDLSSASPELDWFVPVAGPVRRLDPHVLRHPIRLTPRLVTGGTHVDNTCWPRDVVIHGQPYCLGDRI